jgi:PAS domain S-box-containing protein
MTDHLPATIVIAAPGAELPPILQQAGFATVNAAEAGPALDAAARSPDLIIASAHLPDMPGAELCRRLKADPTTAAIPVLLLAPPGPCEADGFLPEPVDPVALVTVVRALLRARQAEIRAQCSVQLWQASFDALSQSVCLLDLEGRAVRCNRSMGDLLGLSPEALSGQPFRKAAEAALGPLELPAAVQKPGSGRRTVAELPIGERWFRATVDPVVDGQGGVAGAVLTLTDITDRKQSEEALITSEERFRIISELTADYAYAYCIQPDGQIVRQWTTGAFASITGYAPEELDEIGWCVLEHPEDADDFRSRYEAMRACQSDSREWRIRTRSGETRWMRDSARSMWDPATGAILVYGAARDITERRQAEMRLQSVMAHGRYLLWHAFVERDPFSPQAYYWSLQVVDEAAAARFLPVEVRPGETYAEAWHRSKLRRDRSRMNLHYRRAIEAGESRYSQEFRCRNQDGEIRWLREDVSIEPLSPRHGRERWHLVGICTDITQMQAEITARRRTERELRETLNTLQAVIHACPLPLMIVDLEGKIRMWNPAAERLFGWSAAEIVGHLPLFVPDERRPEFQQIVRRALQGDVLTGIALRRQKKDGTCVDVTLSTAPLLGADGQIRGLVSILEEITPHPPPGPGFDQYLSGPTELERLLSAARSQG